MSSLDAMFAKLKPKFLLDYHSYGPLTLYPEGWQVETYSTDTPATQALAGLDDDHPAIADSDPDVSGELYTTNGDVTGHAYNSYGALAYTVELTGGSGPGVGGTVDGPNSFRPAASSSRTPRPTSRRSSSATCSSRSTSRARRTTRAARSLHIGNVAPDFVPSDVQVGLRRPAARRGQREPRPRPGRGALARQRRRRAVRATSEYKGGERYNPPGVYYHKMRGQHHRLQEGDSVEVWFTAGAKKSASFTFTPEVNKAGDVLVMAAEDYSGNTEIFGRGPRPGPEYLELLHDGAADAGISYDVYDVDAHSRTAPSPIGVLSHYKAVIWYTADDLYVREPNQPGGTGNSKLMDDEVIAIRDYINDHGSVLVTGQQALTGAWLQLLYNPLQGQSATTPWCKSNQSLGQGSADDPVGQKTNCIIVSNDFIQYYLGAWISVIAAEDDAVSTLPFKGVGGAVRHDGVHAQRRRLGRQPGDRRDVRDDVEHPAGGRVPAVRVHALDRLRPPAVL